MKLMAKNLITGLSAVFLLSACSGEQENKVGENHVWKSQTDTIEQTQAVARDLEQSLQIQQQKLQDSRD